ncbi:hypothetical protein DFA_11943 [Cavenderia fasciculata]|uniref:Kelch repeat-containing protein n=1 Tax=Cavenderia fasciculata TaxID=261658 RepID=F4QEW7_CACFS|nr:uncharacterized protein DFA_11943 [Cavenderia fasciculata]EGG14174.1 hypothetical protein DFA_11943 [Cavenderia fasciculata]|eukprot:XP_004350882.1 hypothetical protein DFA_11943 [Cavenderia fasciculata]
MNWSKATTGGDPLAFTSIRSHTATVVGHKIFVFGGSDANDKFNDLLVFDTKTMFWSKPTTNGAECIPGPHRAHSATLVDYRLFVFGGGDGPNYFKDLYILDTKTLTWSKPITNGSGPGPRRAHTANLVAGKNIYIFGGGDGNKALNEMYVLDTETLTWTCIKANGSLPGSRGYHSSLLMNGKIGVFGGSDGAECFSDFHLFDPATNTWSRLPVTNPTPILAQSCISIGKRILVFGGHNATDYIDTLKLFHIDRLEWENLKCTGAPPQPRGYHCCCFVDHRLFVIGGYDGTKCFPDVHILDLGSYAYYEA